MKKISILVINPGSTSTKVSYYSDGKEKFKKEISHSSEFLKILDMNKDFEYRFELIRELDIPWYELNAVVGRGGLLSPLESGTYNINKKMIQELIENKYGKHASNLGALLAKKIGDIFKIPSYIVDPVVVDEMDEIAKFSGIPEITRKSTFHALNQKGVVKKYCKENSLNYSSENFIVAHLGGGISVGVHKKGRVVDVNNALDGDGPFSPERAGGLPVGDFFKLYYNECYSKEFLLARLKGDGGVSAYLGTTNIKEIIEKIEDGDLKAKRIIDAMCYQVSKEIGGLSTAVEGDINKIFLTGGIANSAYVCNEIIKRVNFIANVVVIPGENEMEALYEGTVRVLTGEEKAKNYKEIL